jgi:hypothetical protein
VKQSSQVVVATCRDSAEAALVRAVLTGHDIPVYISGENHAAMVGMGAAAITQAVYVPRDHAEQARALIEEMREGGEAQLADDEVPADDTAEREELVTDDGALVEPATDTLTRLGKRKRVGLAVLVGLSLGHGTAHMSTRAWKRGFVLALSQVAGWWTMAAGDLKLGTAVVLTTMGMDIVGAIAHIVQTDSPLPRARLHRG